MVDDRGRRHRVAGRRVPTSAVLCAALGGVLPDPWAVLSAGFWLSFGAVAVILMAVAGWRGVREVDTENEEGDGTAGLSSRLRAWVPAPGAGSPRPRACSTR